MSDVISRKVAIEHLKKRLYETALNSTAEHPYYEEIADNRVDIWMNELPPAPQRTGRWIDVKDCVATCSVCGRRWGLYKLVNYCPNCGARMEDNNESD